MSNFVIGVPAHSETGMILSSNSNVYHVDNANISVSLENVSTSFYSDVLVPVELYNYRDFNSIDQIFSFNPNYLEFKGIIDDVASQNVTFNYTYLSSGIIKVVGNGNFSFLFNPTTIYYLDFIPLVHYNIKTEVLLDYSELGKVIYPFQSSSYITLARGWTNLGPSNINGYEAGTVPAVGYSPYNLSVLYVASGRGGPWQGNLYQGESVSGFGGVFKSVDGGKTWFRVDNGLNSTSVNSIVVDPNNTNVVVVSTGGVASIVGGGIYKTVNGGMSWQETYPVGGNFLEYYEGRLYAASYHAVLVSADFGSSWKTVSYFPGVVTTLLVEDNGSRIFVGLYQYGDVQILLSTNYGRNYTVVGNFPGYYTVSQIIANPDNSSQMWALVAHGYMTYPNLFRSYNGGLNWTVVNDSQVGINYAVFYGSGFQNGYIAEVPQAIAYDPQNGSIIYVTGPGYFYISDDGGQHFFSYRPNGAKGFELFAGIAGQDNRVISVDPLNGSIIFKGSDQGLAVSYDGGGNWVPLNNRSASLIYTVAADGQNIFTVAQDFAPIFSNDSGKTWYMAPGSEEGWASVDPYNRSIVLVESSDSIQVSENGGNSFFTPDIMNFSAWGYTSKNVICFAYSPNGTIFAAQNGGVFRSNDRGKTWYLIPGSPSGLFAFAIDPTNMDVLYGSNFYHLYKSTNFGITWEPVNDLSFNSLAVDPENGSIVIGVRYLADYYAEPMISYDGGLNFSVMSGAEATFIGAVHKGIINGTFMPSMFPNISSVDFFGASPQVFFYNTSNGVALFYTTDEGIYETLNLGKTWTCIDYNIPAPVISDLFFSGNGTAYVSTYGMGVWEDPDLNITFVSVPPLLTGFLPSGSTLYVNGVKESLEGYFVLSLKKYSNGITLSENGRNYSFFLNASPASIYYINFAENSTVLRFEAPEVQSSQSWFMALGSRVYSVRGPYADFVVPVGNISYHAFSYVSDYAYYLPYGASGRLETSFAPEKVTLNFTPYSYYDVKEIDTNISGIIWLQAVSNNGRYLVAAGTGILTLNLNSMQEKVTPISFVVCAVEPYESGFIVGGYGKNGALLYYFNPQNGSLSPIELPQSWENCSGALVSAVQVVGSRLFLIGSGPGKVFFEEMYDGEFYNLSGYLTADFESFPWTCYYSEIYVPAWNSIVVEGNGFQTSLGILNLTGMRFTDLTQELPVGTNLGVPVASWYPISESMSTNNQSVLVLGQTANRKPYIALLQRNGKLTDISYLFPADVALLRSAWNGHDYILSGINSSSSTPSVFLLNPQTLTVLQINSRYLQGSGMVVDLSAVNYTSFALATFIEVPQGTYNVIHSRLLYFNAFPLSALAVKANSRLLHIYINGVEVEQYDNFSITPLLLGNYTLQAKVNSSTVYTSEVSLKPFYMSKITLNTASFIESGLPEGTSWSVSLNGTNLSSTTDQITFAASPGIYEFKVKPVLGYKANPSSGFINLSKSALLQITFTQLKYNVTFGESGLPSGTIWSVTLNGTTKFSNSSTIVFSEPNGKYSYEVESPVSGGSGVRYLALNASGAVTVNGSNLSVAVPYQTQYHLTMVAIPSNAGSVSPQSGWHNAGASVNISATANNGYRFYEWVGTGPGSYSG
ncbi:MAG: InlB B-repeat-containing protein, partial [Nitrososphaeria archaeon]